MVDERADASSILHPAPLREQKVLARWLDVAPIPRR
jgi:hypothetical protein